MLLLILTWIWVVSSCKVRKSWYNMTQHEKQKYLSAVEIAMDSGLHAIFVEVHSELQSHLEAHHSCGFLLWHRRFLIAYENMLQSLGPEFKCMGIPYWNYFSDYARSSGNRCNSLLGCSEFLQDMGGDVGDNGNFTINGVRVTGQCNRERPNNHFCQDSNKRGGDCEKCIPRGRWSGEAFPEELGYVQYRRAMEMQGGLEAFSNNVQRVIHDMVHNVAGGTMQTPASNSDPIFYSHHATLDLMLDLYGACNNVRFQGCTILEQPLVFYDRGPSRHAKVKMDWGKQNEKVISADKHRRLKPYFQNVPKHYEELMDTRKLGYSYELDNIFNTYTCNGRRKLYTTVMDHGRKRDDDRMKAWFERYVNDDIGAWNTTLHDMEIASCMHHVDRFGKVKDYSKTFRSGFRLSKDVHARCFKVLTEATRAMKNNIWSLWSDRYK